MAATTAMQYEMRFSGFGDTAFSDNRNRRLHRWAPWIAGFSSSFVAAALDSVRRDDRALSVLDPFAGVGTTLVTAIENGDDATGFEINPYAALACRAKLRAMNCDVSLLESAIERFDDFGDAEPWLSVPPTSRSPSGVQEPRPLLQPGY